ncbi:alpha/beta hydrolase [Variovorax sp. V213]|uniref:alpha/beta fold hydrolase n=1 Tax=Variovorax sp. V213 TaxID=3065955 RepID=UPI0034E8563B
MLSFQGHQVHVVDQGNGPPVLFLHGNPDTSDIWRDLIAKLSVHHRCLAPDLPGYGHSVAASDFDCSLEHLAKFVDDLVIQLGLHEKISLVVHDIGGQFGLAWAVKHPEKVRRIVIFNTAFSPEYRWTALHRIWRTPILGELAQRLTSRRAFTREMKKGASRLTSEQIDRIFDRITPAMKQMALRIFRTTELAHFHGWDTQLRELASRIPVQVLWSDDDPYIAPEFAERFGAQAVSRYRGFGHWLPLEAPELVGSELQAFLARTD